MDQPSVWGRSRVCVSDGRGQSDLISGSECGRQCKVEGERRAGVERKEAGQRDGRDLGQVQEDGSSLGIGVREGIWVQQAVRQQS